MKIPDLHTAQKLLSDASRMNPGPWIEHSIFVAQAAHMMATHHPKLDAENAYILGYLHDIGRRAGITDLRHMIDGFRFMQQEGYPDSARICLTHSFPVNNIHVAPGKWDCTSDEFNFVKTYLAGIQFNQYDQLIQLCDALALSTGFCLLEKRLMDVALRRGINKYSPLKWRATFDLFKQFEKAIGRSIYQLLPGVIANTFGFDAKTDIK